MCFTKILYIVGHYSIAFRHSSSHLAPYSRSVSILFPSTQCHLSSDAQIEIPCNLEILLLICHRSHTRIFCRPPISELLQGFHRYILHHTEIISDTQCPRIPVRLYFSLDLWICYCIYRTPQISYRTYVDPIFISSFPQYMTFL